jgi:hypothetical protein
MAKQCREDRVFLHRADALDAFLALAHTHAKGGIEACRRRFGAVQRAVMSLAVALARSSTHRQNASTSGRLP